MKVFADKVAKPGRGVLKGVAEVGGDKFNISSEPATEKIKSIINFTSPNCCKCLFHWLCASKEGTTMLCFASRMLWGDFSFFWVLVELPVQ